MKTETAWEEQRWYIGEEKDEETEINEYYLRLMYMQESCMESKQDILMLIEEQQELLHILRMRKQEFLYDLERKMNRLRN